MSGFNGLGQFSFTFSWTNDAANGIPITASRMDTQFQDATNGFDNCMTRDGQGAATAVIPFSAGLSTPQIAFPAVQIPSSNPNILDDYEEGIWTPTDSSGAGLTLTVLQALYTKIGRVVTVNAAVTYPTTASTAAAGLQGLPFAVASYGSAIVLTDIAQPNGIIYTTSLAATSGGFCDTRSINNTIKNNTLSGTALSFVLTYTV